MAADSYRDNHNDMTYKYINVIIEGELSRLSS